MPAIYEALGATLLREDDLSAAEVELRHAIQLDPAAGEAHRDLGVVLQRKGQFEEASKELRRAAELLPEDSSSHYMLAQVLQKLGNADGAAREIQWARELSRKADDAQLEKAYNNEGTKLLEEGNVSEATEKVSSSLTIESKGQESSI